MQSKLDVKMFESRAIDPTIFLYLLIMFGLVIICTIIYKEYLKLSWGKAFLFSLFCVIFAGVLFFIADRPIIEKVVPDTLMVLFAFPLLVQLFRKWNGELTEQEKMVGSEGFKAWLSPGNLVCCIGISLSYLIMQDEGSVFILLSALCVTIAIVLIYPFVNWITQDRNQNETSSSGDDISAAQVKIIKMLEEGKISSQECGDLLTALNNPAKEPQDNETPQT